MHYALSPRTFFFSHYFYTGLRIATGVVGIAVTAALTAGTQTAVPIAFGALCTSLMDLPSPLRHKFNEMLASVLLCSAIALIVSLCTPHPWLLTAAVGIISFIASMLVVYGRKAMPLQFAALFTMLLMGEAPVDFSRALLSCVLFFVGGLGYLLYAMAVSWKLRIRIRQQVLAESLYALARYMEIKAVFYREDADPQQQFARLVQQQVVLAEKQQASRDLILRAHAAEGGALVRVHYAMIDLYETALALHTDYASLRHHFAGSDVLPALEALASRLAADIESVAYAMARGGQPPVLQDCEPEMQVLRRALDRFATGPAPADREAHAVLQITVGKAGELIASVARLHGAMAGGSSLPLPSGSIPAPLLSVQRYELRTLWAEMRMASPTFRYALRVALAISFSLAVSRLLPYAAHGYWIALTVAVVLKPNFSLTRQRRRDRVLGTLIGCVITAIVLQIFHSPLALLACLFVATAAGPSFLHIKYRYTAVAATVQALILIGLTTPAATQAVYERLADTLVGALIATFFSYVLPSWEVQNLPRLVALVLAANRSYVSACRQLLLRQVPDDAEYRVSRKRFMDRIAGLSGAIQRMGEEPADKQYRAADLNRFVVRNYLLVSHCAAIRLLLQRHPDPAADGALGDFLARVFGEVEAALDAALKAVGPATASMPVAADAREAAPAAPRDWPQAALLQRRSALLKRDAGEISALVKAMELHQAPG
ncbi:Uncharacterized membrane protein YccC [Noviherbaspirillum humi]|uniref:Uncharacterized membrane protein YccC n=1 Tax=Noviherbaspirillum humi TaxID=1688639 RepID=A0A239EX66_9BURK|nr:FUSC family membrane protein [Noviherbaspirillum humi]SNS49350.1 Uncharacterized membrane protein YccC [Noviherbaspirillum humi]